MKNEDILLDMVNKINDKIDKLMTKESCKNNRDNCKIVLESRSKNIQSLTALIIAVGSFVFNIFYNN